MSLKIDNLKIIPREQMQDGYPETRFVIVDLDGKVIDDAQGYGYKTKQKAHKAMWYRFGGGEQKISQNIVRLREIFASHLGLKKSIDRFYEDNYKELAFGDVTEEDLLTDIGNEYGVIFSKDLLKTYLNNDVRV